MEVKSEAWEFRGTSITEGLDRSKSRHCVGIILESEDSDASKEGLRQALEGVPSSFDH